MLWRVGKDKDGRGPAIVSGKVQSDVLLCRQLTQIRINGRKVGVRVPTADRGSRRKSREIQLLRG